MVFGSTVPGVTVSVKLCSLIEMAKANGLGPGAWLPEGFARLPIANAVKDIGVLPPFDSGGGQIRTTMCNSRARRART